MPVDMGKIVIREDEEDDEEEDEEKDEKELIWFGNKVIKEYQTEQGAALYSVRTPAAVLSSDTEFGQPKLYSSVPDTENTEPRKESRAIAKDELIVVKKCSECKRKIKNVKKSFLCKCKKNLYCSIDCKKGSHHKCDGPDILISEFFETIKMERASVVYEDKVTRRHKEAMKNYQKKSKEEIEQLIESKDPLMAFVIATAYSSRLTAKNENDKKSLFYMPSEDLHKSKAETDEIALKWFEVAAKGGLVEAMISLGHKIVWPNTLNADARLGLFWFARAIDTGAYLAPESLELFETKSVLIGEMSVWEPTEKLNYKEVVDGFAPSGPNLGTMLLATRFKEIQEWKGKTFNGGNFYPFKMFMTVVKGVKSCPKDVRFVAGRAGCSKNIRKCVVEERSIHNAVFRQGERGTKENGVLHDTEQVNKLLETHNMALMKLDRDTWYVKERTLWLTMCFHMGEECPTPAGCCVQCQQDAVQRTNAVAAGLFSISISETLPDYGYGAQYLTADGQMVLETFKRYSQPEICCVLQCLMSNPADLHPQWVAEDPNLYWPIIWYYGSVYSALMTCCGPKLVKKIYGKTSQYRSNKILTGSPSFPHTDNAFPSYAVGEMRMACGNESCPKLDHNEKFLKCAGCKVRYYCNEECQKADWKQHKKECTWGKKEKEGPLLAKLKDKMSTDPRKKNVVTIVNCSDWVDESRPIKSKLSKQTK